MRLALAFVIILLAPLSARAATSTVFRDTGDWLVDYVESEALCRLAPKTDGEPLVLTRSLEGRLDLLLPDPGFASGETRKLKVRTGQTRWNASFEQVTTEDGTRIRMAKPMPAFIDALTKAETLSYRDQGRDVGPFDAKGLSGAWPLLAECTDAAGRGEIAAPANDDYPMERQWVEWKAADLPRNYIYADGDDRKWTARLEITEMVDQAPKTLRLTVSGTNAKPQSIDMDIEAAATYGSIGLFRFDADLPTFVISNYTMGAHCCIAAKAITYDGAALHAVDIGQYDGSQLTIRDIDGDGSDEIDSYDQRFLYAFDSYAGSLAATKIMKISANGADDVTGQQGFQLYLARELTSRINDCAANAAPGICAGLLGNAASLGLFESVAAGVPFERIDSELDPSALECSAEDCGKAQKFKSFRALLEARFAAWGYDTASSLDAAGRRYFENIARHAKGFGTEGNGSDSPCSLAPQVFTLGKNKAYFELSGVEFVCRFEKVSLLGSAALAFGLCSAEEHVSASWLMLESNGTDLAMSWLDAGTIMPSVPTSHVAACR